MNRSSSAFLASRSSHPLPLRAEWIERVEDGIMGTRIAVELWADDAARGNAAIEAVLAEMRRVDRGDEHLQAGQRAVHRQRAGGERRR